MGQIKDLGNATFRDYEIGGVPASGPHEPVKAQVRQLFAVVERQAHGAPMNNLVALLGDSITAAGIDNDANNLRNSNRGMTHWLPLLTRQAFRSPQSLNFGVSGQTSGQIAARVGDVIESGAGSCVVLAGTNDLGVNSAAVTKANLAMIYQALAEANILIVALPILPRTVSGTTNYGFINTVNQWIKEQGEVYPNFRYIEPWEFYDPYSLTMTPPAGYTYDGLHPMAIGMRYITEAVAEYLNTVLPAPARQVESITDHFWPTDNPGGFLNANPMMSGTGGTAGSGVTGDVANDWTISTSAGGGTITSLTVTASKDTSDTGLITQDIVIGGTATGGFQTLVAVDDFGLQYDAEMNAGDQIEFIVDFEVIGGTVGISGVAAFFAAQQNGTWKYTWDGYPVVSDDYTVDGFKGVMRTPAMTLTHDVNVGGGEASRCGIWISLKNSGTTRAAHVKIISAAVRKVV